MTIGIYALYWEEQDLIYIGKSQDIENRFKEHVRMMQYGTHHNYKVQEVFERYGAPTFTILEQCNVRNLNDLEAYWTAEFNSLNCGLNIVEAGTSGFGINSSNSKYSELEIKLTLRYLSQLPILTAKQVSSRTNVSFRMVQHILSGNKHLWLKDKYPFHYELMTSRKSLREQNRINVSSKAMQAKDVRVILSPEGIVHKVECLRQFARDHSLDAGNLSGVLTGRLKQVKGWKLQTH